MIKLIVTDLDGTLLDSNKNLNPDFWAIHQQLREKGILFSVASGRQYFNLEQLFEPIKDHLVILAENGTFVKFRGEEIHLDPMDKASANKFIEVGRTIADAEIVLCGKKSAYIEKSYEAFLQQVKKYYGKLSIVDDLTLVEDTILKVTLYDFAGSEKNSYPHFKPYQNQYKVSVSGHEWLDITDPKANKGTAIEKIQEKFGITKAETMVFGDYLNDLEMMQAGDHSYAMKNAHPDIIRASRFVTEQDNDHDGVLETIRKTCLS